MNRSRRMSSLQKFASVHASIHNHFSLERHLTTSQSRDLAVDPEVKQGLVAQSPVLIKPKANGPHLLLLQSSLRTDQSAFIPRPKFMKGGVH